VLETLGRCHVECKAAAITSTLDHQNENQKRKTAAELGQAAPIEGNTQALESLLTRLQH
jgi:hypothetical protein